MNQVDTSKASMSYKIILIIGNGPSTKQLVEYGFHKIPPHIDTFGMVLAYRYFEKINWWPTYYGAADSKSALHHNDDFYRIVHDPKVTTKKFFLSYADFEHQKLEKIKHHSTGSFCFNKALELGYKTIYLIGMEGSYVEEIAESRELTEEEFANFGFGRLNLSKSLQKLRIITKTPEHNPNYFFDDYQRVGDIYSLPQAHKHRKNWIVSAYKALPKDVKVYNLSQKSKINVFQKISFDDFIKDNMLHSNFNKNLDDVNSSLSNHKPKHTIEVESAYYFRYKGDTTPNLAQFLLQPPYKEHLLMLIFPKSVNKNDGIACELLFECVKSAKIKITLCGDGQTGFEGNHREVQTVSGMNQVTIKYRFCMKHIGFRLQLGALEEPLELFNIKGRVLSHQPNVSNRFNYPPKSQLMVIKAFTIKIYYKIRNRAVSLLLPENSSRRKWVKRIKI